MEFEVVGMVVRVELIENDFEIVDVNCFDRDQIGLLQLWVE